MTVKRLQDEGQTLPVPRGKVLGIVDTRPDLERLIPALQAAGFTKIEELFGEDGVNLLERINSFFFSDLEDRVLTRHIEELKAGHLIIIIDADSNQVDEVVKVASENGARRLVHFGAATITWLTK